jgi:menaquinone-dependent protoporphyrinogen oxidase
MPQKIEELNVVGTKKDCCGCGRGCQTSAIRDSADRSGLTNWKHQVMKPVAVLYATREGHTERIAERVAVDLRAQGFSVEAKNLREYAPVIKLSEHSAVVLAASVHAGKHESEMVEFVRKHRVELEQMPTAFLSVTLSEAGAERPDSDPIERARFSADVQKMIDKFIEDTGWHPVRVKPVAGALLYSKYNFFEKFIMKRIAGKVGAGTDTSRDYDYTDWEALDGFANELAEAFSASGAPNAE